VERRGKLNYRVVKADCGNVTTNYKETKNYGEVTTNYGEVNTNCGK
jgi:hypothetical protein